MLLTGAQPWPALQHTIVTALLPALLLPLLNCAGLSVLVQSEREARLAAAQSQVAFDAEVAALKLGKLQAYFNSTLCEHTVTVHPLAAAEATGDGGRCSRSVSTLATPELPQEVQVRGSELLGTLSRRRPNDRDTHTAARTTGVSKVSLECCCAGGPGAGKGRGGGGDAAAGSRHTVPGQADLLLTVPQPRQQGLAAAQQEQLQGAGVTRRPG